MNKPSPTDLSWRMYALFYIVIALSAPLILFPELRLLPGAKLAVSLLFFVYFLATIRREWKSRALNLTLPEIYAQAKGGRRFTPLAIQTAACAAVVTAVMKTL